MCPVISFLVVSCCVTSCKIAVKNFMLCHASEQGISLILAAPEQGGELLIEVANTRLFILESTPALASNFNCCGAVIPLLVYTLFM